MKKFAILLFVSASAFAQTSISPSSAARRFIRVNGVPATCSAGDVMVDISVSPAVYYNCPVATPVAFGGSSGITALTGDGTASGPGSAALTLSSVGAGAGSCTNCSVTFDAKGRETTYSSGSGFTTPSGTGALTATGGALDAATTAFTPNPTASTIASRDSSANMRANSYIDGYTTTATAAGTTTLTVASTKLQFFTGSTTQTVVLPVASTLVTGQEFYFENRSTGTVTVNSSGANLVLSMPANTVARIWCILTSGTSAASWSATPIARTDVAQTFPLAQTFSSSIVAPSIGNGTTAFDFGYSLNLRSASNGFYPNSSGAFADIGFLSGGFSWRNLTLTARIGWDTAGTIATSISKAAAGTIAFGTGADGSRTGFYQQGGDCFVAADATNATTTMATSTCLVGGSAAITVTSGRKYSFTCEFFLSDSTSVDGAQIDFNGGTATATNFRAQITAFDTALNLSSQITALATAASASTFTGAGAFEVHGSFEPSSNGTFLPRFAQVAHTTGTLTLARGSNCRMQEM